MNEYQRFISYIYSYPGNVRDKNVGFAKIEVRNGQCRLDMTLNGVHMDTSRLYGVHLMVNDLQAEGCALVQLGRILVNGGQGKYRDLLNPENLNGSGFSLSDGIGLAVVDQDDSYYRMFSLWNDDVFKPEKVHFLEKKEVLKQDRETETKPEAEKHNEIIESADESVENTDESMENTDEPVQNVDEASLAMKIEMENLNEPVSKPESEVVYREEFKNGTESIEEAVSRPEIQAASAQVKELSGVERVFRELAAQTELIDAFEDDVLYDCIEVSPEQLKKMFGNNQAFDKNSFMMHGFFRYRHLLLGRVQENDNNTQYFIGIPGMYCNRERYMASVFGFANFKRSHRSDYSNPYFGYWYQEM